ncbi:hypothetical protein Fot_06008 [Forsythia ovata]|uniref:Uncharacterized protein n=1 Tax=Forsythia ovata TaxID=205694 RepID=A0ABD1WRQ8_9LAMI
MSGFYFSSVPKLKIRRGGVMDDIPPSPPVPSAASVPGITVVQTPETMRKVGANSRKEVFRTPVPPPASKYEYINIGSRRGELDPTVLGKPPTLVAIAAASVHKYWTSTFGKAADNAELAELLKLLDPTVLGKLPAPTAIAAALVHKYWTSAFGKAANNAELAELLKLAEMYNSRGHVINCE